MYSLARRGLAVAIGITLAACSGPGTSPAPSVPAGSSVGASDGTAACVGSKTAGTVQVEIEDFVFKPDPVQAKVGGSITWTNKDAAPHSAALDDGSCKTDGLNKDVAGSLTFTAPGTYAYHCAIHPEMKGTIVVGG